MFHGKRWSCVCAISALTLVVLGGTDRARAVVLIDAAPGYSIAWDGNDGANFDAGFPASAPANLANAGGASPIGSSQLDLGVHFISNVNNGTYGNASAWIGANGDPDPFIGVAFNGLQPLTSVAWGRDNGNNVNDCCGGQLMDRSLGVYTLQRTMVAGPSAGTPETGDASTGWETIGTINYASRDDAVLGGQFTEFFRHEYSISQSGAPVAATAFRLKVPGTGIGPGGTAVDEIEAYSGGPVVTVPTLTLIETGVHDINNVVPDNLALAANGAVAFAKDVFADGTNFRHQIDHLNDGLYGNEQSWIGNSAGSFSGIDLGGSFRIGSVAWGRDNGGVETSPFPPDNAFTDRTLGTYVLQYTTVPNPDANTPDSAWMSFDALVYDGQFPPSPSTRHLWSFTPVEATGIRLLMSENGIAIDEIEVFAAQGVPEPATVTLLLCAGAVLLRRGRRRLVQ